MPAFPDVPDGLVDRLRAVCETLPEAAEAPTRPGVSFKIRRRDFARLFTMDDPAGNRISMLVVRADPDERQVLLALGHPFFASGSGTDRVGVLLDDDTDWEEVAELVTESYRLLAPQKLVALLPDPSGGADIATGAS
jgi:predicted DNA-binding protein (MmcQ/YjbR family)